MTVQTKNDLTGWREATGQEQTLIKESLLSQYKKSVTSKYFWGIVMAAIALFLVCGVLLQTAGGAFGLPAIIFFLVLAALALAAGISLCARAGKARVNVTMIAEGDYSVLDCMCIQTDHRVDGNLVSLIRIRSLSGQECEEWLSAPRSLARSFDALAQKTGQNVPDFPMLLVRLNTDREYHFFQKNTQ